MKLNKAFPENGKLKNLKKFQAHPLNYMQEAVTKFGSPIDLNLPMGEFVVVSDPEQAATVFTNEREYYRKSKGYKEIALVLGNGLLTAEGEEWHAQRKALQPSFHKNEIRKLLPAVWETARGYLSTQKSGTLLRLDSEMSGLTMTILLNSLIKYQSEEMVSKMSDHIVFGQDFIVNRIRTPLKWPVWVPTKTNQKYHTMMKDANDLIQKCVDDRKAISEEKVDDILDVLMEQYDPDEEFIQIRNQLLTFSVAGHETSAIGMTWTLHLLAHYPEIQERLYQEVKELGKLEDLDLMNFSNLEYTQQVIKESLRLYPPIWNIVRRAIKENEVGEFHIPKGKQLMLNIFLIHRNPEFWDNPEQFNPDRFKKGSDSIRHKFQYIPFGAGGRYCIGNNFALFEMMILLIQFVRKFKILPKTKLDIGFKPLLTLRPEAAVEVELQERD